MLFAVRELLRICAFKRFRDGWKYAAVKAESLTQYVLLAMFGYHEVAISMQPLKLNQSLNTFYY